MIGPRKLIYCNSRRRLLKGALGVAGLYALSQIPYSSEIIPRAYAQAPITEIDVGTLQVPVTLDGQVQKDEWYSDSIDYQSTYASVLPIPNAEEPPKFHFRTKYDSDFTYAAFDIPTQIYTNAYLHVFWDTKSTRSWDYGADGVYNLVLRPLAGGGFVEEDCVLGSNGECIYPLTGTSLNKLFTRGKEYDWAAYYGPSPLNQENHLQFEIEIQTDILLANAKGNQINYQAEVVGAGAFAGLASDYIPMVFKAQPLPEFDDEAAILLTSLVGAAAATKLARRPMSRRNFLGISTLERSKKHGRHDESWPSRGSGFNL